MNKWLSGVAVLLFGAASSWVCAAETQAFTVTSPGLANGATVPKVFSCEGNNTAPPVAWSGAPGNTASFALIVYDPDAKNGFYHWVVYNIPQQANAIPSGGALPAGAVNGMNSDNKIGYTGPCPPPGPAHHYIFTLYALDKILNLPEHADAQTVVQAMGANIVKQAQYTLMYGR